MNHFLTLGQVQSRELEILLYVASVCEKHGLTYFLSYGSLLGAVRHKGFIPWDDDIDISMPRLDYERFARVIAGEKSDRFLAMLPERKDYPYHYIKVVDLETELVEDELDLPPEMGLWIDVFPLDGCSGNGRALSERLAHLCHKCRSAAAYKVLTEDRKQFSLCWWLCRVVGFNVFKKLIIHFSKARRFAASEWVAHFPTACRFRFPRQLFENVSEVEFEGHVFPAPVDSDQYLTILYKDYMRIPPENERRSHLVKVRIKE